MALVMPPQRDRSPSVAVVDSSGAAAAVLLSTSSAAAVSFWEPGGYKPTLRRINDTSHLCSDFIALVNERADIEAKYASMLRKFSEKWNSLIDKGPEYGSMQSCWKSVLIACDRLAAVHATMHEEMLNDVAANIKQWQKQHLVKHVLSRDLKFKREIEDEFKRAQKSWEKLLREVAETKADYFHCCQKEKSSIVRERNVAKDQSVSVEQRNKYEDETHKLTEAKNRARDKYGRAVRELAYATPKYREDMKQVFSKCQEREAARMEFFKKMFFRLHECLDLSARPQLGEIFSEFYAQIDKGDGEADLRWWENTWGPAMPMPWPTEFEEYRDDAANKNITGNANNKVKLASIVPLPTTPLSGGGPTSAAQQQSFNYPPQTVTDQHKTIASAESLARQATALMHAVRPVEPAEHYPLPHLQQQAVVAASETNNVKSSTSRAVTTTTTQASAGIALTSYQEHGDILPTIRYKPKQSRAEVVSRKYQQQQQPWTADDVQSSSTQAAKYGFTNNNNLSNGKMRAASSEYQLNDTNDTNATNSNNKPSSSLSHQVRRSRGSVAEPSSSSHSANNNDVAAARRASVITLSSTTANQHHQQHQRAGQTLPVSAVPPSSSSSASSSGRGAAAARSSTLYYNNNNNSARNSDHAGDTPPPTYERPINSNIQYYDDDDDDDDDDYDGQSRPRGDNNQPPQQSARMIASTARQPVNNNNNNNFGGRRAHAVGAIGHAAGKRFAAYEVDSGASHTDGSSLERHFVDNNNNNNARLRQPRQVNEQLQNSAVNKRNTVADFNHQPTVEPFDSVIAEIHEKLQQTKAGRPLSHHHQQNGSDNISNAHALKNKPKISLDNDNNHRQRKSRSRSRSRQRSSDNSLTPSNNKQHSARDRSSSSQDRATNTEPPRSLAGSDSTTQTPPAVYTLGSLVDSDRRNDKIVVTSGSSAAHEQQQHETCATSGNVRAKIKSFTTTVMLTNNTKPAASPTTISDSPPFMATKSSAITTKLNNSKPSDNNKAAPFAIGTRTEETTNFVLQQQQQHQQAVSPESGAASSIDSENGSSLPPTAAGGSAGILFQQQQQAETTKTLTTFTGHVSSSSRFITPMAANSSSNSKLTQQSSSGRQNDDGAVKIPVSNNRSAITAIESEQIVTSVTRVVGGGGDGSSKSSKTATAVDGNSNEWESDSVDSALDNTAAAGSSSVAFRNDDSSVIGIVKAIYDYKAEEADEISLHLGEVLAKTQQEDAQGWCKGRKLDGREGLFPASFVVDTNNTNNNHKYRAEGRMQ